MRKTLIVGKRRSNQGGFTYLMMLAAVVVLGLVVGAATTVTTRVMQADREAELIFRGIAYRDAIKSYYEAGRTAGRPVTYPRTLEELRSDPRFPNKKHIRALYRDPFSDSKGEWVLVRTLDGGIGGVASKSSAEPLKKANFPKELEKFQNAGAYTDWVFEYVPPKIAIQPQTSPAQPPSPNTRPPIHSTR